MKIIDILSAPWAIQPEKLAEIMEIYYTHARGDHVDLDAVEKRLGKPLDNQQDRYTVTPDGVAVIPVEGVLGKKMNMFSQISGGSSTQLIGQDFRDAMSRADVRAILLEIDSPGGTVDGTQQLAQEIFQARGKKPMTSWVDGNMGSAAAWIGAAADQIYIGSETAITGSIGVVTSHTDISKAEEARGVKTTEIVAGKYKRIASKYGPLSDEGRAVIQETLDYVYSQFVNDIAAFRGVSPETALADMADGRVFVGSQAVSAGLVDGIATKNEVIANLVKQSQERKQQMEGEMLAALTLDQLRAGRPDLVTALLAEGQSQGAKQENERIQAIQALAIPGHEALVKKLAFDGTTTGPEAALQILQAEQANQAKMLKTLETEAVHPAQASMEVVPEAKTVSPEEKWDADESLRAQYGNDKGAYLAFVKAEQEGKVKLFTRDQPVS